MCVKVVLIFGFLWIAIYASVMIPINMHKVVWCIVGGCLHRWYLIRRLDAT